MITESEITKKKKDIKIKKKKKEEKSKLKCMIGIKTNVRAKEKVDSFLTNRFRARGSEVFFAIQEVKIICIK